MIEAKISELTYLAIRELYGYEPVALTVGIEKTRREITGDFTILVFPFVKISRKSPEVTATEIGTFLQQHMQEIASFNVIKGFLNLVLTDRSWLKFLTKSAVIADFGFHKLRQERPVVLEYSSPNTNKPLHLGHIRNNLLGYALAEILKANGHKVIKVNLVNDRGIHICKSMLAYMKWGKGETPESAAMKGDHLIGKYYVLFDRNYKEEVHDLIEKGLTEEEAERQAPLIVEAQEILRKWEAKDHATVALWKQMNGWAYDGFDVTYHRLGVDFDHVYYESETYLLGKKLVLDGLEARVLVKREDGSIWADLRDEGLDEKLLLRADGTSVYMTQDLGTAQLRYDDYHPSSMIYVVGNEQNYHFDVLRKVLARLGKEYSAKIHHLSYGMVELPEGKMKSREGTVVDADDLMDEMFRTAEETTRELGKTNELSDKDAEKLFSTIGLGALKYFILKVDPKKNMMFDPRESIDFNGNTGPFIQYTYARIQSLLSRAGIAGHLWEDAEIRTDLPLLPLEKETIRRIYQFQETVTQAGEEFSPAVIANYIYELAKGFNGFYQELPVLKEEEKDKIYLRLLISKFTGQIIQRSMALLGIEVPERM
jgi:arginyl-tRNA synthetase